MGVQIDAQAVNAAAALQSKAPNTAAAIGSGTLISLFTTLFPTLMQLFTGCIPAATTGTAPESGQSAVDYIAEHHDIQSGQYDQIVLGPATTQAMRAGRQAGARMKRFHARDVAIAALDTAQGMSAEDCTAAFAEISTPA